MLRNVAVLSLACCCFLLGCDTETPERVEGLERRVDGLIDQQRASAQEVSDLKVEVEQAKQEASTAQTKVGQAQSKIALLEEEVAELKKVQDRAVPPEIKPTVRPGRPDPAERYRIDVDDDDPARGPADAKVTVVMISDFQCPFCARAKPTMDQVEREYGRDVRIIMKHNPLPMHNRAMAAARAAMAAHEQGKFWQMHDKLFANQRALTDENFLSWAKELGLDVRQFKKDIGDSGIKDDILADQRAATKVGARGTPAFFVNGRFLSGAQPFTAFKTLIDEEMKEADRRITAGTARADVYDELMRSAKPEV